MAGGGGTILEKSDEIWKRMKNSSQQCSKWQRWLDSIEIFQVRAETLMEMGSERNLIVNRRL